MKLWTALFGIIHRLVEDNIMSASKIEAWPDLAIGLYEKLVEHNAELSYEFDHLEIDIPMDTGNESKTAHWQVNGTVKIRGRDL